jgi:cytidylate kinase
VDGPAGSGKTTTARAVAERLGFRHLDSGALYRALTFALMEAGIPEERWPRLGVEDLAGLGIEVDPDSDQFDIYLRGTRLKSELRSPEVTARVSYASSLSAVREWLLSAQRDAGASGGLVAEGRDMGTVVFPDAEVKVFLVAELQERARRRLLEKAGDAADPGGVEREAARLEDRDRQDSERPLSPLRRPEDATVVDTTRLSFEEQVEKVVTLVRALDQGQQET